jgi:hypothetical protein
MQQPVRDRPRRLPLEQPFDHRLDRLFSNERLIGSHHATERRGGDRPFGTAEHIEEALNFGLRVGRLEDGLDAVRDSGERFALRRFGTDVRRCGVPLSVTTTPFGFRFVGVVVATEEPHAIG